jgi:hypothetical protein
MSFNNILNEQTASAIAAMVSSPRLSLILQQARVAKVAGTCLRVPGLLYEEETAIIHILEFPQLYDITTRRWRSTRPP